MRINFDKPFVKLNGEKYSVDKDHVGTMAKTLAFNLADKVRHLIITKAYDFAVKLENGGVIEVDRTDAQLLIKDIKEFERLPVWAVVQLCRVVETALEESEKPQTQKKK